MSNPPCRLFATDLDGTVLCKGEGRGSSTTPRLRRALKALQERGVTVVLASGRMHESMARIAAELELHCPLISYNGALACLPAGEPFHWQEPLIRLPLDSEVAGEVVDLCESRGLSLNFYWGGKLYARKFQPWWDMYHGRTTSPMEEVPTLTVLKGRQPHKLLMLGRPEQVSAMYAELAGRFTGRANVLITDPEYLEFMNPAVNKGSALSVLMERLGIRREEVVAAGDGLNDVEMLATAGTSVAVRTADTAMLRAAHYVVGTPEDDGVAGFIEEHLLGVKGLA